MLVNGCDCLIVIKTQYHEMGVPYAEETIREAVSLLKEKAAIEGDGSCRAIRKSGGVTGCGYAFDPWDGSPSPLSGNGKRGLPVVHVGNPEPLPLQIKPSACGGRFPLCVFRYPPPPPNKFGGGLVPRRQTAE
jgi:hypothetical protein